MNDSFNNKGGYKPGHNRMPRAKKTSPAKVRMPGVNARFKEAAESSDGYITEHPGQSRQVSGITE